MPRVALHIDTCLAVLSGAGTAAADPPNLAGGAAP